MFTLDATTASLEVVLAGAVTTNQLPIVSSFADKTATALTPGKTTTQSNNTSTVTIVAAPAASTQREVHTVNIYNADTVAATITVRENDNGTLRILIKTTLSVGDTLQYGHNLGWRVCDSNGNLKTTFQGGVLAASSGGTGFGSYTIGDLLYADTASTLAKLADVATGNALISGGVGVAPSWGKIGLTTHVSGTLPVANGGTGTTTATGTAGSVVLSVGPTITGTLTATGLIDISGASAGQIKFPATQNPSADANTLDDYEEGTWTVGVTFGGGSTGVTYTSQVSQYVKIGKQVLIIADLVLSNKGSSTGTAVCTGLPFTTQNVSFQFGSVSNIGNGLSAGTGPLQAFYINNSTVVSLSQLIAGASTVLNDTNFTNTSNIILGGHYPT